jgi:DNA-binding MarR family transcriptional regulator
VLIGVSDPEPDGCSPLPPSAQYVYHVLDEEGPLPRQQLLEDVELNERTLDRALDRLQAGDYVEKKSDHSDLRRVIYRIDRQDDD